MHYCPFAAPLSHLSTDYLWDRPHDRVFPPDLQNLGSACSNTLPGLLTLAPSRLEEHVEAVRDEVQVESTCQLGTWLGYNMRKILSYELQRCQGWRETWAIRECVELTFLTLSRQRKNKRDLDTKPCASRLTMIYCSRAPPSLTPEYNRRLLGVYYATCISASLPSLSA